MAKFFMLIIVLFILISSRAYSINLGSLEKNSFAEIRSGESAKFKMLFWNNEDESYTLKISVVDFPKDWIVIADPEEFVLNKSVGEEYVALSSNENVKAKVVNIFVKSANSESGNYFVTIKAETKLSNQMNGINIIPERLFKFEVHLTGSSYTVHVEKENGIDFSGNYLNDEKNVVDNHKTYNLAKKEYFYLFSIFLISLISFIIYKKY